MNFKTYAFIILFFGLFLTFPSISESKSDCDSLTDVLNEVITALEKDNPRRAKMFVASFFHPSPERFLIEVFGDVIAEKYTHEFKATAEDYSTFLVKVTRMININRRTGYSKVVVKKIEIPNDVMFYLARGEVEQLLMNMRKPVPIFEVSFYSISRPSVFRPMGLFFLIDDGFRLLGYPPPTISETSIHH